MNIQILVDILYKVLTTTYLILIYILDEFVLSFYD